MVLLELYGQRRKKLSSRVSSLALWISLSLRAPFHLIWGVPRLHAGRVETLDLPIRGFQGPGWGPTGCSVLSLLWPDVTE